MHLYASNEPSTIAMPNKDANDLRIDPNHSWISIGSVVGALFAAVTMSGMIVAALWTYHSSVNAGFKETNELVRKSFDDLHQELRRLSEDQADLRLGLRELEVRSSYRWTSLDQKEWAIGLRENNPTLNVPAVEPKNATTTRDK